MVNKELAIQTIKKMLNAGMDDDVIESTFADVGLAREEVRGLIKEAKGLKKRPAVRVAEPEPAPEEEGEEEEAAVEEPEAVEEPSAEPVEEPSLPSRLQLEESLGQLENLNENLESVKRQLSVLSQRELDTSGLEQRLSSIEAELSGLRKDISEIRALNAALQSLLKKLLETEREKISRIAGFKKK